MATAGRRGGEGRGRLDKVTPWANIGVRRCHAEAATFAGQSPRFEEMMAADFWPREQGH